MGKIGQRVVFQGATAKNRALVAAFEQKLARPIHVSRYCHLTGALGVALLVKEQACPGTRFKGFGLWKENIPVRQETCQLCTNHCKLTIADMADETVAFGFLCGRDYQTKKMVPKKAGYNMMRVRKRALPEPAAAGSTLEDRRYPITIGIPAAIHVFEDARVWQHFFTRLGIQSVVSNDLKTAG